MFFLLIILIKRVKKNPDTLKFYLYVSGVTFSLRSILSVLLLGWRHTHIFPSTISPLWFALKGEDQ